MIKSVRKWVGVSTSGFYALRRPEPNARKLGSHKLHQHIAAVHRDSNEIYGS